MAASYQARQVSHELEQVVGAGETTVITQVLTGLGGVGKTQLAASYARAWQEHQIDLMVWVTAASRVSVLTTYSQAAAEITGWYSATPEQGADRLLAWLATTDRPWLIVLDDLQLPDDLAGLWPPATPCGRVLVTTRRRDGALQNHGRFVDVGVFNPAESTAYLHAKLRAHPDRLGEAKELAADLGHLPLALAQAAAYMADRGLGCADYRCRFADSSRRLRELLPELEALPDDYRVTMAVTWEYSVQAADELAPRGLARPLLQLASVLDPNTIPISVLAAPAALDHLSTVEGRAEHEVVIEEVRDALHNLRRLSLITLDGDRAGVHDLVQRATRDTLDDQRRRTVIQAAADAVTQVWPAVEHDLALSQVFRATATALAQHAGDLLFIAGVHPMLFRAGQSLGQAGLVSAAVTSARQLLADSLRLLGADHPDTLTARHNLAFWRGEAGDPAGAAKAFEDLLADRLRVLSADHPDTLDTRQKLAYWRGQAGDAGGAVQAVELLLADCLRVLGPDHFHTLNARHNLARWLGAIDPASGVGVLELLLADCLRVLGPDHLHTLNTRNYLARWLGEAGDPARAVQAFEHLLADYLRVLGPDHRHTLTTRHNLASWRGKAGDPVGAVQAFEHLLADRLRVLGPDHPHTLTTRHNLAFWRGEAGDPAGAVQAFEQLLADRLRVLGTDHPDTLTTRGNLARWRGEAGDPTGAVQAFEQLLADRLCVLGPEHPHTLTTRDNLARWRGRTKPSKH